MTDSLSPPTHGRRWKLVALDVDGTLLDSKHMLGGANMRAISRVRSRGVEVVLVTSRPPAAIWPILADLGMFHPEVFVSSQGALTGSFNEHGLLTTLAQHRIGLPEARAALAIIAAAGLNTNWYADSRWLVSAVDPQIRREAEIVGCTPTVADLAAESLGPDKMLVIAPNSRQAQLSDLIAAMPDGLTAQTSNPRYLEITRRDVDKAGALSDLCRARGIAPESVVAIGDGRNDLGMLGLAGMSVAPANAHPDVLAVVDLVTSSNDDDAVARALDLLVP